MKRIRVTLEVHKEKSSDFNKYLNEIVWGLRHNAQVDEVNWIDRDKLVLLISVRDRDEKWSVLSELLTWVYCEQYGDSLDIIEMKCYAL